jgi:UDP-N-acetylmuramate--alanine ligase
MFNYKSAFIIGVGGAGMNGIANILLQKGLKLGGNDNVLNDPCKSLIQKGLEFCDNESITTDQQIDAILKNYEVLIASSAVKLDHPLVVGAKRLGLPFMNRLNLLPELLLPRLLSIF